MTVKWFISLGVVVNLLDGDIVQSEFKYQMRYYIHFRTNIPGKGFESPYSLQLFLYIDGFSIK